MAISFDKALGIHEQAMQFRALRAEVLANNLVNVDTPNFKARDIDFRSALQQAQKGVSGNGLAATRDGHIGASGGGSQFTPELQFRMPLQPSIDGNTVDEQSEMARFAKNSLDFQTSFQMLSSKFKGLRNAIKGDV